MGNTNSTEFLDSCNPHERDEPRSHGRWGDTVEETIPFCGGMFTGCGQRRTKNVQHADGSAQAPKAARGIPSRSKPPLSGCLPRPPISNTKHTSTPRRHDTSDTTDASGQAAKESEQETITHSLSPRAHLSQSQSHEVQISNPSSPDQSLSLVRAPPSLPTLIPPIRSSQDLHNSTGEQPGKIREVGDKQSVKGSFNAVTHSLSPRAHLSQSLCHEVQISDLSSPGQSPSLVRASPSIPPAMAPVRSSQDLHNSKGEQPGTKLAQFGANQRNKVSFCSHECAWRVTAEDFL